LLIKNDLKFIFWFSANYPNKNEWKRGSIRHK